MSRNTRQQRRGVTATAAVRGGNDEKTSSSTTVTTTTRTPLTPTLNHNTNPTPTKAPLRKVNAAQKPKPIDATPCTNASAADESNPFILPSDLPPAAKQPKETKDMFSRSLPKSISSYDFKAALSLSSGRSRPSSPIKKISESGGFIVTDALRREASSGLLSKGDARSQFDILKNDYTPPPRLSRSRSQPAIAKRERVYPREPEKTIDPTDRFITNRAEQDICATLELMHLNIHSASPGHTARLVEATGLPVNKRILSYQEAPPVPSSDPFLSEQREHVKPLLRGSSAGSGPGMTTSSGGSSSSKTRKIATQPERVLDAPGMVDDFYLNLVSWSAQNVVAVALGESTYTWRADTGSVTQLGDAPEGTYVSSVEFSQDGAFLAIGIGTGAVELWDAEAGTKLRTMHGHQAQVPSLSWNGYVVSSGCGDGSIWYHDVRIARHKVMELLGHDGEVCGLKWRPDGELLASGGNDNVVNIWDARIPESLMDHQEPEIRSQAKFLKRNHTAAVKALGWCPWQSNLLASGGGTNDATIHIWNSNTGARLHSLKTSSQITSIHFSPHRKEILSTHGYPDNAIMVHAYPSLNRVAEIREAHDARVLFSCVSPAGDVVLTGAGDENLKFWRVWDVPEAVAKMGKRKEKSAVSDGLMAIR